MLIDELVEAYLQQIIFDGFAHADPHPGNVHLTKDRKIALMDLGMVAKFSPNLQEQILKLLIAISKYNGEEVSKVLLEISQDDKTQILLVSKRNQPNCAGFSEQKCRRNANGENAHQNE